MESEEKNEPPQPPAPEDLRKARADKLLEKWSDGGRLTKAELQEIAHRLPATAHQVPNTSEPLGDTAPLKYQKKLREYCAVFGTKLRAIKRWLAIGRAANIGDNLHPDDAKHLPPLDDPPLIVDWWPEHMSQRVPAKLLKLKLDAQKGTIVGDSPIDVKAIDLAASDEPLQQARRYLAAADKRLTEAYASGDENRIARESRIWTSASETFHSARRDAEQAAKSSGEYVSRAGIASDLSQLMELLRNMRLSMRRRVLARLGEMPPELAERIGKAIDGAREDEDVLIRRLPGIVSPEDLPLELVGEIIPP